MVDGNIWDVVAGSSNLLFSTISRHRLTARTRDFHSRNWSSILHGVTIVTGSYGKRIVYIIPYKMQ